MFAQNSSAPKWPEHFQPSVVRHGFGGGKLSAYCLALEAWRRGLKVTLEAPNAAILRISDGEKSVRFNHSKPDKTSPEAVATLRDKYKTSQLLRQAGIPVPISYLFDPRKSDYADILESAKRIGFPVVLKPVHGSEGNGVFANITHETQLHECYQELVNKFSNRSIVLERHHNGDDFRIYVIGEFIAACTRLPANIIGDGISTIEELISKKNETRKRNPFLSHGLIEADYEVHSMLARSGWDMSSIPPAGSTVVLREKSNASAGGDVIDVTNEIPPRIRDAAISAVRAIDGLFSAGVDVLWDTQSHDQSDFVIIEMNSRAHIGVNMYPTNGTGIDMPKAIIDEFFPNTPRRSSKLFSTISFDRRQVVSMMTSKLVREVSLYPLSEHAYPVRFVFGLKFENSPARVSLNRLARTAARLDITCTLRLSKSEPDMVIGAPTQATLDRFLEEFTRITDIDYWKTGRTIHVLYAGFRVT